MLSFQWLQFFSNHFEFFVVLFFSNRTNNDSSFMFFFQMLEFIPVLSCRLYLPSGIVFFTMTGSYILVLLHSNEFQTPRKILYSLRDLMLCTYKFGIDSQHSVICTVLSGSLFQPLISTCVPFLNPPAAFVHSD